MCIIQLHFTVTHTHQQFGLSSDTQPFFAVEMLLDHPKKRDHLGVTTGETVFVLLRNHPKLTEGLYLVEKEDGTSELHLQVVLLDHWEMSLQYH